MHHALSVKIQSLIFNHLSAWYIQERVILTVNVPFPKLLHEAMQKLHSNAEILSAEFGLITI